MAGQAANPVHTVNNKTQISTTLNFDYLDYQKKLFIYLKFFFLQNGPLAARNCQKGGTVKTRGAVPPGRLCPREAACGRDIQEH